MPPLVIANSALVRLIWTKSGLPYAVNVLGATNTGGATFNQALAESLGAAVKTGFTSSGFVSRVSSDIALANVGVRNIAAANLPEFVDTGGPVVGTEASDPLPGQTSLCVTLRTTGAGPSYRGRVYLPGFAEASNDTDGTCDAASATDAVDFINACTVAFTSNGLTMAVLSRPREATVIPARTILGKTGFATNVTAVLARDRVWDTQRRRQTAGI